MMVMCRKHSKNSGSLCQMKKWLTEIFIVIFAISPVLKRSAIFFFTYLVSFDCSEPNFLIYCASCPRSFTKVNSLQKHYYRKHKTAADDTNDDHHLMIPDENRLERTTSNKSELKTHVAKFLLCAKEQAKLSQTALDVVKDSVKALFNEYCEVIKQALAAINY